MREPRAVAVEHLDPREQVVPERHGLRALEVRVARHRGLRLRLCEREADERERVDRLARLGARVEDVKPERRGDLVVPRTTGMDLPTDLAQLALDRGMDVLGVGERVAGVLRERCQPLLDLGELVGREDPRLREPLCVQRRRLAVVREQLRVVRAQELPHFRSEGALDAPGPGGHASILARVRAACSSVSSEAIRMSPSAASCGKVSAAP